MNKTTFCNNYQFPKLASAVIRQFGGWDSFKEDAIEVANHSIDAGFHGFTYYTDTLGFFRRNRDAIMELAREQAREFGSDNAFSMIAGFNCLKHDKLSADDVADAIYNAKSENAHTVRNALAWYAGEEVCRAYADAVEER